MHIEDCMNAHTIHHVTAVSSQIQNNLEFYTQVLGLRLVKKSVNQDDVSAYHLFYADSVGSPGTDLTFFDWPNIGSTVPGPGTVSLTSFRIPSSSIGWWAERLEKAGLSPEVDENAITFADPEGQRLELVAHDDKPNTSVPWGKVVEANHAIQGIAGVSLESARPASTIRVLTELLGYEQKGDNTFETADEGHFARLRVTADPTKSFGRVGAGGVHHVAFRVKDDAALTELKEKIEAWGIQTSGEINRFWFRSVYSREPGGVLFELATDGPGFGVDEDMEHLGETLVLPPFLEGQREQIEQDLKPLSPVAAQI